MKRTFKTPKQLQNQIDRYFSSLEPEIMYDSEGNMITDKNGVPVMTERKPATVSSLVYAVGLASKSEFYELGEEYNDVISRAMLRTEAYIERMLFDKAASGGAKYLLQESFGHEEQDETSEESGGVVLLSDVNNAEE